MESFWRPPVRVLLLLLVTLATGCIIYSGPTREGLPTETATGASYDSPVQAYLVNGDVVRFRRGVRVSQGAVEGNGERFAPDMTPRTPQFVSSVALDSVIGLEVVQSPSVSPILTILANGVGFVGSVGLFKAIFGSCPTIYVPAEDPADSELVAELFSYSVAPLLEARDVDVYPGVPVDGRIRLDLRNEALETHFINHLELLEVPYREGDRVLSDNNDRAVALSGWVTPSAVRSRDGRDVLAEVGRRDQVAYATSEARLRESSATDTDDWIEVEVPRDVAGDSIALSLRLRNSLLNTVFLYDFLLSGDELQGLSFLGEDLARVGTAVTFGQWYQERMGMHLEVWDELRGDWVAAGRIPDTGPIAWKETAAVLPVPQGDGPVRMRLRFVADQWRLDELRVATEVTRPRVRTIPVSRVVEADGAVREDMRQALNDPDVTYLETRPGTALWVEFEVGEGDGDRRFLLGSQGYYTEWVRPEWIAPGSGPGGGFVPGDQGLEAVLREWQEKRAEFEARFLNERLPTVRAGGGS